MQYLCIKRVEEKRMAREMVRQGGRSARIQQAVHAAARALLGEVERAEINVPLIAERAGVTPSTIYRRWGDVTQVLADVAAERLRPATPPDDTGSWQGDMTAFVLQYAEEMSSAVGRRMLRDVLAESADNAASRCCQYTDDNLAILDARARARGEPGFDARDAIDLLIAPLVYHILFADRTVSEDYARALLARFFAQAR
jgi:AcrR family transcriptional regulator